MKKNWHISRRKMLQGIGTAMALPVLDIMAPSAMAAKAGAAVEAAPVRMGFWFVPNGVILDQWTPRQTGELSKQNLPYIMQSLEGVKGDINVLSGLTHDKARANGDGAGDHARCGGAFLTGAQPRKTAGADIRVGTSVDQVAAQKIGTKTKLPSLELGMEKGRNAGQCDSGYSCSYSNNISWKTESTPMAKEVNPRLVFERLFGDIADKKQAEQMRAKRLAYRKSVLDFVADDAKSLLGKASQSDKRKMDEYFTSVREIEQRIERAEKQTDEEFDSGIVLPERPEGIPRDFEEHARLMADMQVLAFQTDSTRIATFMLANAGSNRSYRKIGVPEGHHHLSHHRNKQDWIEKLTKINELHMQQFAYMINRMKQIKEGERTLLDNTMMVYGSAIGDGNRHSHHGLPVVLAGHAGGKIKTGQHISYARDTPMNNLFLKMLELMGTPVERLGDSTGLLRGLS